MGEYSNEIVSLVGELIDLAGVAIIAVGVVVGALLFLRDYFDASTRHIDAYDNLRTFIGRTILLGLEFLVAGDIIKTVAIEPTINSVLVLAIIVLVRTVLSLSIDVEIDGRWPWQAAAHGAARGAPSGGEAQRQTRRLNE